MRVGQATFLGFEGLLETRELWILGSALAVIPMVSLPRLDALKYTSLVALLAAAYLVSLVCVYAWIPHLRHQLPCKQPQVCIGLVNF